MFKNMKIWKRFLLGFGLILVFLFTVIIVNLNQISVSNERLARIVEINNVQIELAHDMIRYARQSAINVKDILLFSYRQKANENVKAITDDLSAIRREYNESEEKLESLITMSDTARYNVFNRVRTLADTSRYYQDKIIELALAGKPAEGGELMFSVSYPRVVLWIKALDEFVDYDIERNALRYAQIEQAQTKARTGMIILGILSVVLSILIVYLLTISITKPIKIATTLVTTGDITMDLSGYEKGGGEFGMMIQVFKKDISEKKYAEKELKRYKDNLEEMVKQRTADLSSVLMEVKETVNILVTASSQILAAATQISSGTAETATAITETTTTVEEVQQSTKQSADKAKNVVNSAQKVAQVSQNGQKAVDETINGMNRIHEQMDLIARTVIRLSEQSQSIGAIIASVTEIADQSNLLAVNAAIEAAKAGEHGKGFAVVAQEIRNLAEQSKKATSEVRIILNDIQKATSASVMAAEQGSKAVETGLKQSALAGEAIRILAGSINEAVESATQILASSQQQVVGMDQVGMAMQNINQAGTETSVSMVQTEKSAKNLYELGQKLKEVVERFNNQSIK